MAAYLATVADKVRPGPGDKPKVTPLQLHVTEAQRKAFHAEAVRQGLSMAGLLRQWIDELLLPDEDE